MSKVKLIFVSLTVGLVLSVLAVWSLHDNYKKVYEADYVGSEVCGGCHIINHQQWKQSPHHKITQIPSGDAVVGNFAYGEWYLPKEHRKTPLDELAAVKTYTQGRKVLSSA